MEIDIECKQNTAKAEVTTSPGQSKEVSSDTDRVPDGVEVILRGRTRPRLLPKPKLMLHGQSPTKQQSNLIATDSDVNGFKQASSTFSSNSAEIARRQEFEIRTTGLTQLLDGNDEKLPFDETQKTCRRFSEPVERAGTEPVEADALSEQQQSRGLKVRKQEAGSIYLTLSENKSRSSFIPQTVHGNRRKLSQEGETFRMWTVSLDAEQIQRVELFYASHATQISVCRCLASLYSTSPSTGRLSVNSRAVQNNNN